MICDRCGWAGDDGVVNFVTVSDLKGGTLDSGQMEQLYFCRENGCAGKVRTPSMIAAKIEREKKNV